MKVVLISPPTFTVPIIIPNLGLGYLASILRKNKHLVTILDYTKEKIDYEKYRNCLDKEKPDIIGVQVYTCNFNSARQCIDIAKQLNRETITIVGGPHPSGDPVGTMETFKNADFAFSGEAELGLPKLLEYIESKNGLKLESIEGLIYRHEGEIIVNKQGRLNSLDDIPFPSWDLIDPRTYPVAPHGSFSRSLPVAPIVTARGCPFDCTYCAVKVNSGRKFRMRSIDNIIEEIKYLQKNFGIKEIHIEDDNFTLVKSRVIEFCERLKKENIAIDWACPNGVRLDTLDKELLLSMESTGCYSFAVGIESGSPKILCDMKRQETLQTMIEKVRLVASISSIRMTGYFIMGYPSETKFDMEKTIELSLKLPLHRAQFSNFCPLPGTEIYNRLIESGEIVQKLIKWDLYHQDNKIVYSPSSISKKELRKLMRRAFAKFYFRLPIILGLLKEIHSLSQLKTVIFRVFAIFR